MTIIAPDSLNLRIFNGFHYGASDDVDEFGYAPDWHPPGRVEDRITELFEPFARSIGQIDLIQLHSGSASSVAGRADATVWDLAYWGRRDTRNGTSTAEPLRRDQIGHWQSRMRVFIERARETWPSTPIWLRTVRDLSPRTR